jgi:hypothetical protein
MTVPFLDENPNVSSIYIAAKRNIMFEVISSHRSSENSTSINPRIGRPVTAVLESPGLSPLTVTTISSRLDNYSTNLSDAANINVKPLVSIVVSGRPALRSI